MKTAIAYVRISDEDQSNFSIEGQQAHIREYAERQGIEVIRYFVDEGKSAKNFNRPQWRELESFLKNNRGVVSIVIVCKYDRIIRNAAEGLTRIPAMELDNDIRIVSVFETFGLDPESPFFFKLRADLLVTAEFERLVIRDRVRMGRDTALRSGRFIGMAPFGFINGKDDTGRPFLVVDPERAKVVRSIFSDFASGTPRIMVIQKATENGWQLRGNGSLERMLQNPLYVGRVPVAAYKGRPADLVAGIHQPIVSEELFERVQQRLNSRPTSYTPKVVRDEFPLRGFVADSNGHQLTGCLSTGKKGVKYPYYKCNKCNENISATKAHTCFESILEQLSLSSEMREALVEKVRQVMARRMADAKPASIRLRRELGALEQKILSLEEKFITGQIDQDTYQRWKGTWTADLRKIRAQVSRMEYTSTEFTEHFESQIARLGDLKWLWQRSTVQHKQSLVRGIFPRGLIMTKTGYRTPFLLPIFSANARQIKGLEIETTGILPVVPFGGPGQLEIEHFIRILQTIPAA